MTTIWFCTINGVKDSTFMTEGEADMCIKHRITDQANKNLLVAASVPNALLVPMYYSRYNTLLGISDDDITQEESNVTEFAKISTIV